MTILDDVVEVHQRPLEDEIDRAARHAPLQFFFAFQELVFVGAYDRIPRRRSDLDILDACFLHASFLSLEACGYECPEPDIPTVLRLA